MKTSITKWVRVLTVFVVTFGGSGCGLLARSTTVNVEVRVRDPEGKPVKDARAVLLLPRYGDGRENAEVFGRTDRAGVCRLTGSADQDYEVGVEKEGYYPTMGPWRHINTPTGMKQYAVGLQVVELELRPIRNPIPSLVFNVERLKIPKPDTDFGFDLEIGDWVQPDGKGRTSDLVFRVEGETRSPSEYEQTLHLAFSNACDGYVAFERPGERGSKFKFPYEAPADGYVATRAWRKKIDGEKWTTDLEDMQRYSFIVRIRSVADELGQVTRALHGVINGIYFGYDPRFGPVVSFLYRLNTDWTRNLEFDSEREVRAGTGQLAINPPPPPP